MNNALLEQTYKDIQADRKLSQEIRKASQFDSFILVAKARSTKYAVAILNCLSRLLSTNSIAQAQVRDVLDATFALSKTTSDIQVKILQFLPLLFANKAASPRGNDLATGLSTVIGLLNVTGIVGSIASATLQQTLVGLFDNAQRAEEQDVNQIFEDLCASFSGSRSVLISFEAVKKPLLLELLESILVPGNRLCQNNVALIDAEVIPALLNAVKDEQSSYILIVRVLRICRGLISKRDDLLLRLLELLPKASPARQILILEVLSTSVRDVSETMLPNVVQTMLLFEDSIPGLGTYSVCAAPRADIDQFTTDGLVFSDFSQRDVVQGLGSWLQPSRPLISQLNATDVPRTQSGYKYLLLFQLLSALAERPSTIWKSLLVLQSAFLSSSISSEIEAALLFDYSQVVTTLGQAAELHPRDTYLRRLGRISISSSVALASAETVYDASTGPGEPTHRSFSCLDAFLSIATQVRNSFTYRSWKQVLDILHSADSLLSQKVPRGTSSQGSLMSTVLSVEERPASVHAQFAADISRLTSKIQLFFTSTDTISDESFSALIQALCDLPQGLPGSPTGITPSSSELSSPIFRRMDSISSLTSFSAPSIGVDQNTTSFSLQKLRDILPSNIRRLVEKDADCGWTPLSKHLSMEIDDGNVLAAELLGMVITQATQSGLHLEWQQRRFLDALSIFRTDGAIQIIQLETLAGMLEILGHDLISGWDLVLKLLSLVITQDAMATDAIRIGFSCLQHICTDLLTSLPSSQMSVLITTLVSFSIQRDLFNIALSAVGQFWTILDALPTEKDFSLVHETFYSDQDLVKKFNSDEMLWLLIIDNLLSISHDDRPEVRNSAVQACFRVIKQLENVGTNAYLTSTYLILPALSKVSIELGENTDGLMETSNAIVSGSGRALLSATESVQLPEELRRIWHGGLSFLKTTVITRPIAIASFALRTMFETLSAAESSLLDSADIWPVVWRTIMDIGSNFFEQASSTVSLTEEAIATYLNILKLLSAHIDNELANEQLRTVMNLTYESLSYPRCLTYTLDVDYMSKVQKSALGVIEELSVNCGQQECDLVLQLARPLELASRAETRTDLYNVSKKGSSSWTGRPTFIALTEALLEFVARKYTVAHDTRLETMITLIEALNLLIQSRFSRVSVANTTIHHELWKLAAKQVFKFVDSLAGQLNTPITSQVWPAILATVNYLMQPHPGQSEEFTLAMLNSFRSVLIPSLALQPEALVLQYLEHLYRGSWFYSDADQVEASTKIIHYYNDQIIREWCLLELFKTSILTNPVTTGSTAHANDDTITQTKIKASAALASQFAIKRSQNILLRYVNNASLRAHAPLPRIEYSELLLLLEHLSDATIEHENQRALLKSVYKGIVESLLVSQRDMKLLNLLKDVLLRVGLLL